MNLIKAIWQAVLAFLASWWQSQAEEAKDIQDKIVKEAQEAIEQVPEETDEELLNHASDLGLVSRMRTGRAEEFRPGARDRRQYQSPYDRVFSKTKK